ncbi:hypothetical protein KIN20_016093 [Parelaphostrongylus tenuis]|uniref:Uncharacterized protein n=1 Tax=Parelaphostrongylus tenuis TaxID=148309 RepID=A0AAD5N4W4_PARTN|nr:hypothetical protein KIN20_016093 [Parelaphostrongylus tenuis]
MDLSSSECLRGQDSRSMAPAPETASRDFLKIIDELWEKNSKTYIKSPNQFFTDVNEIFADKVSAFLSAKSILAL